MKYIKGSQETVLKDLTLTKVRLIDFEGDTERIWVRKGKDEVYLGNHSVSFNCPTWGVAFPCSGEEVHFCEAFPAEEFPEVLTLHPDAWEDYLKNGIIDKEGNLLQS